MPDETQTVTLPAADWQIIIAALWELPGKYGVPVINRLQAEVNKPTDVVKHFPKKAAE
jgi:hypothetical protein